MKRGGFARPVPRTRQWDGDHLPGLRAPRPRAPRVTALVSPIQKEHAIQSEPYMAAVRTLACYRCGIVGYTQFCHRDEGKGAGLKTDSREGWPGCGPHGGEPGCHWYVGTSGRMSKTERREFELRAGRDTRAEILRRGLWPARLPLWERA